MIDIRYVAGFFDADGSVGIYKRNKYHQINVIIANSGVQGLKICQELQKRYGGCITFTKSKKSEHRKVFWWKMNGASKCKCFLESIYDHSIIKTDQIKIALEFIRLWENMPKTKSLEQQLQLKKLADKCKELKHTDILEEDIINQNLNHNDFPYNTTVINM